MPIPSSDLVTVPREVLEFYADIDNYKSNWIFPENVLSDRGKKAREALTSAAASPSQSDVGRTTKEDVQGSIATKQPADLTSAPATETTLENYIRTGQPLFSTAWEREEYERLIGFTKSDGAACGNYSQASLHHNGDRQPAPSDATKSDGGVESRHAFREERIDDCRLGLENPVVAAHHTAGLPPGPSDQLTKTPSADHDAGNLRSLAEPPSPRLTDGDQTGGVG